MAGGGGGEEESITGEGSVTRPEHEGSLFIHQSKLPDPDVGMFSGSKSNNELLGRTVECADCSYWQKLDMFIVLFKF